MPTLVSLASCLLPFLLFALEGRSSSFRPAQSCGNAVGRAIYFLTNDDVNGVAAIPIGSDGTLSQGTVTETGGAGSVALSADNQPATPDALVGPSALAISGNHIFAVNAGSNTLSMLAISTSDPTQLTVLGNPIEIPGEFPNTVAVSAKNNLVCVGTTGALAGISCSCFSDEGLGPMDGLRPFDLRQTTPPVGPTNTVSQSFFSEDESVLFTTVKGDPPTNKTGFLSAFPVKCALESGGRASLSQDDVRSTPEGTAVLFGSQVVPGTSNIFATDAAFGATILSVDSQTLEATTLATGEIENQAATCWATISVATGTAFVTDVGVNHVVEMSVEDASIISELDLSANSDPGLIDLQASGNFVYALSPGNGTTDAAVTVIDVSGGPGTAKMIQHFGLDGVAGKNAMGMVVLE
ncbi:uncharacterized protein DNG_09960 [Cephalotrichum gorgonifer]|uniref:3-carboxymuconate cyclase n=1 Tax=Cephalotrichum gorgonifer TaxID=2041049 RepID=A0AAE8N6Q1_9PEZI|nr:uncharacterized protein DNG_09960 [Cephalotrichum gorgonifer]